MKPSILLDPDDPQGIAWLVDEHSEGVAVSKLTHDHLKHYKTAIRLDDLDAGEFRFFFNWTPYDKKVGGKDAASPDLMELWADDFVLPRPRVFVPLNKHPQVAPSARRLTDRAACVLLHLAAAYLHVTHDHGKGDYSFNAPIKEGQEYLWDEWEFLTAWMWSVWEYSEGKVTVKARWEQMKAIGYPHGYRNFTKMVGRHLAKGTD